MNRANWLVILALTFVVKFFAVQSCPAEEAEKVSEADRNLAEYFQAETQNIAADCLNNLGTLEEWQQQQKVYRQQLFEMLGLDPLPEKTDLQAEITKTVEGDGFKVHNLHFQSMPGLYVTANLYVPNEVKEKLPAILYVCGHGAVRKNDISYELAWDDTSGEWIIKQEGSKVSYGNKVHYHHHGAWFARNGYVCLMIDSLQLGEIEGIHHGTYRYDRWWWLNRGYTPAGVEAWNCIRALDYLQTLPEVDPERLGVTGRSGGGAYSWWIAALDERIKVAVPVAGITDLQNHVVDGCVDGHCDCMYFVNTYRWDYPMVAALVAPRPLLISNTDSDGIFPLDGVYRTFQKVRKVYALYGKEKDVALNITAGPHQDTQELRIHAFRWFNHYLKGTDELVRTQADKMFEPEQLRVFQTYPEDSINAAIDESFVAKARAPKLPLTNEQWQQMRESVVKQLREKTFRGWPEDEANLHIQKIHSKEVGDYVAEEYHFTSQPHVVLRFLVIRPKDVKPELIGFDVATSDDKRLANLFSADEESQLQATQFLNKVLMGISVQNDGKRIIAVSFCPRGSGVNSFSGDEKKQTQIRRRFYLLGQTLDAMRIYDIRRGLQAARQIAEVKDIPVKVFAEEQQGVMAAYAALFDQHVSSLQIWNPPKDHRTGPYLLNVSKQIEVPLLLALIGDSTHVHLVMSDDFVEDELLEHPRKTWNYPLQVDGMLKRERLTLEILYGDGGIPGICGGNDK